MPDPDFKGFVAFDKREALTWTANHERDDLIMYWDEGNKWWRVTTVGNFESDEYWHGQPPEAGSLEQIMKETP